MADSKTIDIPALVDVVEPGAKQWMASVMGERAPYTGFFALGESFAAAREGLAGLVYLAAKTAGEGPVGAVRVWAVTRRTFDASKLEAAQ